MFDRLCVLENLIEKRETGAQPNEVADAFIDFYSTITVVGNSKTPKKLPNFANAATVEAEPELPSFEEGHIT
jgi:hypothetical protein